MVTEGFKECQNMACNSFLFDWNQMLHLMTPKTYINLVSFYITIEAVVDT